MDACKGLQGGAQHSSPSGVQAVIPSGGWIWLFQPRQQHACGCLTRPSLSLRLSQGQSCLRPGRLVCELGAEPLPGGRGGGGRSWVGLVTSLCRDGAVTVLGNGQQGEDPPRVEFNSPSPKQAHTAAQLKGFIGQSQLQEEVQQILPQPSSRNRSFCSLGLARGVICPPAGNSPQRRLYNSTISTPGALLGPGREQGPCLSPYLHLQEGSAPPHLRDLAPGPLGAPSPPVPEFGAALLGAVLRLRCCHSKEVFRL